MTTYERSKELYFCEVIETGEVVYFYITQDISIKNSSRINTKISAYTSTGYTQNLGRKEYVVNITAWLTDSLEGTMEEKYRKLDNIKNKRQGVKLVLPNLPDGTNEYYIADLQQNMREPSRLTITLTFTEILQSAIKTKVQNLVGAQAIDNIKSVLTDRGFI